MTLQLRALHSSFNTSNVEFYSWTKLDNHAQRVTFRAPVAQKDLLLAASGVLVPFLINLVCRDDAARASRDSTSSVVWLGKRGYPEALTLIKQLEGHLGLAMSKESFGVRCASTALDAVRRLVSPADSKYCDSNIKIKGAMRFVISGLPMGCSRAEIIKRFSEWKHGSTTGWAIIPVKHWVTSGQSHWLVKADTDPLAHFYNCKECRVLIQPEVVHRPAPKSRASSRAPVPKKPEVSSTSIAPAPVPSALLARVVAVEGRLDTLEARSTSIETQLQQGFAQILDRLDNRPAGRRAATSHTGETPPSKSTRIDAAASAKAPPGLPAPG